MLDHIFMQMSSMVGLDLYVMLIQVASFSDHVQLLAASLLELVIMITVHRKLSRDKWNQEWMGFR